MISVLFNPHHLFHPIPHPSPLVTISFFSIVKFLGLYLSLFFLCSFVLFLKFHIWGSHMAFVFLWLISLTIIPLALYMFLQMARFHSLWLPSNIPLCVCVCACVCVHVCVYARARTRSHNPFISRRTFRPRIFLKHWLMQLCGLRLVSDIINFLCITIFFHLF